MKICIDYIGNMNVVTLYFVLEKAWFKSCFVNGEGWLTSRSSRVVARKYDNIRNVFACYEASKRYMSRMKREEKRGRSHDRWWIKREIFWSKEGRKEERKERKSSRRAFVCHLSKVPLNLSLSLSCRICRPCEKVFSALPGRPPSFSSRTNTVKETDYKDRAKSWISLSLSPSFSSPSTTKASLFLFFSLHLSPEPAPSPRARPPLSTFL